MPNEADTVDTPRNITNPELRDLAGTETGEIIPTDEADSLDEVHADAYYNRKVMGPAGDDPTVSTPGTDAEVEPGPGPEDNEALDNATGNAMSAAAESGATALAPPNKDRSGTAELAARNLGQITTTFDMKAPGEQEGASLTAADDDDLADQYDISDDDGFDPGEHTVAEVEQFMAENPELREDVINAERAGKNRSSLVG